MILVVSGADASIDKDEIPSALKKYEWMNNFKTWIRKVQSNAEKAECKFCCCEIRAHWSDLNGHYASNTHQKYQRNAVSHACGSMVTCRWLPAYGIFVLRFRPKNSSFRLPYQRPSSFADCARELFNGSTGSASLVDCTRKKIFGWVGGADCLWLTS